MLHSGLTDVHGRLTERQAHLTLLHGLFSELQEHFT